MRRASLLLYLSLSTAAAATPGPSETVGPLPGYLGMHAKTRGFSLGKPMRATPTPDGKQVLFLRATAASPELRLYSLDVATGQRRESLIQTQPR